MADSSTGPVDVSVGDASPFPATVSVSDASAFVLTGEFAHASHRSVHLLQSALITFLVFVACVAFLSRDGGPVELPDQLNEVIPFFTQSKVAALVR